MPSTRVWLPGHPQHRLSVLSLVLLLTFGHDEGDLFVCLTTVVASAGPIAQPGPPARILHLVFDLAFFLAPAPAGHYGAFAMPVNLLYASADVAWACWPAITMLASIRCQQVTALLKQLLGQSSWSPCRAFACLYGQKVARLFKDWPDSWPLAGGAGFAGACGLFALSEQVVV